MALDGDDRSIHVARFGACRFGAVRFGFLTNDVTIDGSDAFYSWSEVELEDEDIDPWTVTRENN